VSITSSMPATSGALTSSTRFAGSRLSPPSVETWTAAEWARECPDTKLVWLAGKSIYVLHDLKTLQADPGVDVIISGHSHVPKIDTVGGVLYLNPGSAGPRRFKLPITLATLEVIPAGMRPAIHDLGGS
jgi:uncharacterized protein